MSSLGEVQRIIGLSLSKIQVGRNQRGGLPLHKNLLVATVLNKARDVYMQETMYMNYRLMACGQFNQEDHDETEEDDTPDSEDYDEDSESDVDDETESTGSKGHAKDVLHSASNSATLSLVSRTCISAETCSNATLENISSPAGVFVEQLQTNQQNILGNDEGFIDDSDCDCDARNFSVDAENRIPFQYCFNCAPFHPSNGRGPTLVSPQHPNTAGSVVSNSVPHEYEDKLIYDMDSKSTRNQSGEDTTSIVKRKRQISQEESDQVNFLVPKRRRDLSSLSVSKLPNLEDSEYQEETDEVFHPAFRNSCQNGSMEVDQITSLVSIFSFGQQLITDSVQEVIKSGSLKKSSVDEEDSDSDSDTSSDSGHSSDDLEHNNDDKSEEISTKLSELSHGVDADKGCSSQANKTEMEVNHVMPLSPGVTAAV